MRSQNEFSYGGDASVKRPELNKEISDEECELVPLTPRPVPMTPPGPVPLTPPTPIGGDVSDDDILQ